MPTDIRFATLAEVPELMTFIDTHWRKNHILATHQALFEWQYVDNQADRVNMVIAKDPEHPKLGLLAVLGFIPLDRYDTTLTKSDNTVWYALWKLREDVNYPGLGLALKRFLQSEYPIVNVIGTVGINQEVEKIYQLMGYQTGVMQHAYLANRDYADFQLIKNPIFSTQSSGKQTLYSLDPIDWTVCKANHCVTSFEPAKTPRYLNSRYGEHPFYDYQCWRIQEQNTVKALFVTRTIAQEAHHALRIIDFIGDPESVTLVDWQTMLNTSESEYIDFVQFGFPNEFLTQAGFQTLDHRGDSIVPQYTEPFLSQNIELRYAIKHQGKKPLLLCKGDADQDRPNILS